MFSMTAKKITIPLLAAALFLCVPLSAAVQVRFGKILLGSAFQFPSDSPAEFECLVVNPDPKPHRVMIRLQPAGNYGGGANINCSELEIPARCTMTCRFPVQIGNEEKFTYTVFEDGLRRPGSTGNECSIKFPDNRTLAVGLMNDFGEVPGSFKQNRYLSMPLIPVSFRGTSLPRHREIFRSLHAVILIQPDFSLWTSEQFSALMEYVFDGGLLIFTDPEGVLAAAKTPLATLLPVVPIGIRTVAENQLTSARKASRHEVKYLDCVGKSDRQTGSLPAAGFYESRCGMGTVRLLPFAPVRENFPGNPKFADRVLAGLLNVPVKQQSFAGFRDPLDKLTGFTVPHTAAVRNLLILYFALLLVILILGFRWKRHGSAWAACTLTAVAVTAAILFYVNRTLGQRGALAAVLRVENASMPGSGKTCYSLFAPAGMETTIQPERSRNLFENLPVGGLLRFHLNYQNRISPLELRVRADDQMEIRDISLAARSSRQFLEHVSAPVQPGSRAAWEEPRLKLSQSGLQLIPWKVPGSAAAEAVFVLFPNGSKPAQLSLDGICTMKNGDSALADPLVESLRRALEKSYAKKYPAVVVISSNTAPHPGLDSRFQQQGKTLTLYPAGLETVSGKVAVPSELVVLAPAESGSRMAMEGGRINPDYQMQVSMGSSFLFRPALSVRNELHYSGVRIRLSIAGGDRVEPQLKLTTGLGRKIKGRKTGAGEYFFPVEEKDGLFAGGRPARLEIEGKPRRQTDGDASYSTVNWSILDLRVELQGETTENKETQK